MYKEIKLYQFSRMGNVPNLSPFCMKLETYLRMTQRAYQTHIMYGAKRSPRGKVPFILYGDETIGDSSLIIERLEADCEVPLDHHLSAEQQAEKLCVQRMLEEHFYWIIIYSRWHSKVGWAVWSAKLKKIMPPILGSIILKRVQSHLVKQLIGQGVGRFDDETVVKMGLSDLEALNTKMADRLWYFNNKPSTMDAVIYSFLGACLVSFWPCALKNYILTNENMLRYYNNLQIIYFPEFGTISK